MAAELLPELLAKIFLYNKGEPQLHPPSLTLTEEAILDIRNASQVCRHWRESALSCPFLWIDMAKFDRSSSHQYERWINLLLDRSNPLPLVAEVSFPPSAEPPANALGGVQETGAMRILFSNFHRIGTLRITIEAKDYRDAVSYFDQRLFQPAPSLQAVEYQLNRRTVGRDDPDVVHYFVEAGLPEDNVLTELKLFNVKFTSGFARKRLSNLSHLEVSFHPEKAYTPRTTTEEWFDILRHLPHLAILTLDDWITGGIRVKGKMDALELPHLEILSLDRDIGECVDFLTNVKFPSTASLSLRCRNTRPGVDWQAISTYLWRNYDFVAQRHELTRVDISVVNSTLGVYVRDLETLCLQVQLWPPLEDDFEFSSYTPAATEWMKNLGNAQEVRLALVDNEGDMGVNVTQDDIRSILAPFNEAETVWTDLMDAFLWAFERCYPVTREQARENRDLAGVLLPAVKHIYCYNWCEFQEHREMWKRLLDFVQRRIEEDRSIIFLGIDVEYPIEDWLDQYIQQLTELGVEVYNRALSDHDSDYEEMGGVTFDWQL